METLVFPIFRLEAFLRLEITKIFYILMFYKAKKFFSLKNTPTNVTVKVRGELASAI